MDKYIKTVSNECIDIVNTLMNDNTIYLSNLLKMYLQYNKDWLKAGLSEFFLG